MKAENILPVWRGGCEDNGCGYKIAWLLLIEMLYSLDMNKL
jgi:hypothetical protein